MRVSLLAVLTVLLFSASLRAQDHDRSPYSTSVNTEGAGFRLGHARAWVHLGIAAEAGYDTNVFYLPQPIGAPLLRVRAHADLTTLAPKTADADAATSDPKIALRLSTQVEYREYLTGEPLIQTQRSLNLYLNGDFTLFPRGHFVLLLSEVFVRTVDPRNEESAGSYSRDYNRAGFLATFRSRSSRLIFGIGDYFHFNFWETNSLSYGDSYGNEAQTFLTLRVRPKTDVWLTANSRYLHYYNNAAVDALPLRVKLGATTLLGTWFSASVAAGYGNSFNRSGPSASNVIGSAEARFLLPHAGRISLVYDRDFYDSLFANYYLDNYIGLVYEQPLVYYISARLDAGVRFRHYDGLTAPSIVGAAGYSSTARDDRIYGGHAELTYVPRPWVAITANYNLLIDDTNFLFLTISPTTGATIMTPVAYTKHSVLARLDFAY